MTVEAGVLIDLDGNPIFWHLPQDRSVAYLPDSRTLWNEIWHDRKRISGFAHSHPGCGIPGPSQEDLTTFAAVELALGKRLIWWIVSGDEIVELVWVGPDKLHYETRPRRRGSSFFSWVQELRDLSGHPHYSHNDPVVFEHFAKQITEIEDEHISAEVIKAEKEK